MNHIAAAVILFGLGTWIASGTRDGYRDGKMPFVWLGGINPLVFDRARSPAWFWGATVINVVLGAAFGISGLLVLAAGRG